MAAARPTSFHAEEWLLTLIIRKKLWIKTKTVSVSQSVTWQGVAVRVTVVAHVGKGGAKKCMSLQEFLLLKVPNQYC